MILSFLVLPEPPGEFLPQDLCPQLSHLEGVTGRKGTLQKCLLPCQRGDGSGRAAEEWGPVCDRLSLNERGACPQWNTGLLHAVGVLPPAGGPCPPLALSQQASLGAGSCLLWGSPAGEVEVSRAGVGGCLSSSPRLAGAQRNPGLKWIQGLWLGAQPGPAREGL